MAKRGPKPKGKAKQPAIVSGLQSRNISVAGHRTSMRLEPSMWDALDDIAHRENLSIHDLCTEIKARIDRQAVLRDGPAEEEKVTLTSAVRVLIAQYYRRAATPEGHQRAGHGSGDPFAGTLFADPPTDGGDPPTDEGSPHGGDGQDFSGSGKPPGVKGKSLAGEARLDA